MRGWAPEGTYTSFTQGTSTQFATQVAQTYGDALLAMAGSGTATITSAYYVVELPAPMTVPMPINSPSGQAWVGQDPQMLQWFAANIQEWVGSPVPISLYIIDVLVGTVS